MGLSVPSPDLPTLTGWEWMPQGVHAALEAEVCCLILVIESKDPGESQLQSAGGGQTGSSARMDAPMQAARPFREQTPGASVALLSKHAC